LWTPPQPFDTRRAWTQNNVRVEAAAFGGRLVWLEVIRSSKPVDAGAETTTFDVTWQAGQSRRMQDLLAATGPARRFRHISLSRPEAYLCKRLEISV
jgi:hypothetical protein